MKRSTVPLLVCMLALDPGALLFPSVAGAIPAIQNSPLGAARAITHPHGGMPVPTAHRDVAAGIGSSGPQESNPDSPACRQSSAASGPVDTSPATNRCIDSPGSERFSVRFGRRMGTHSDILGAFDGVRVDYRLTAGLNLNGIAGYPVLADGDEFNSSRQVFGISAATRPFAGSWNLSGYLIEQQENGQSGSRTLGGVLRYLRPERSLLVYLDYAPEDHSLDMLTATGAWRLPFRTTLSAAIDLRNHPLPGREQQYLQQTMNGMEGWNWMLPTERLALHTAGDNSGVGTLAVGLTHALSRQIKLSGDVAVLDASHDTTTDAATDSRTSEYFYHLKLTGEDLLIPGDHNKLDLRHNVTQTGRISSAVIDTRYAINRFWKLMPRVRADYSSPGAESPGRWVASPAVKLEYRRSKQFGLQIEAGGDWSTGEGTTTEDSGASYFVSLGYQAKF